MTDEAIAKKLLDYLIDEKHASIYHNREDIDVTFACLDSCLDFVDLVRFVREQIGKSLVGHFLDDMNSDIRVARPEDHQP